MIEAVLLEQVIGEQTLLDMDADRATSMMCDCLQMTNPLSGKFQKHAILPQTGCFQFEAECYRYSQQKILFLQYILRKFVLLLICWFSYASLQFWVQYNISQIFFQDVLKNRGVFKCYFSANTALDGWILASKAGIVCPCQKRWRYAKYHRGTILRQHHPVRSGHR